MTATLRRFIPEAFRLPYIFSRNRLKDWQHQHRRSALPARSVSADVVRYLRADNPRLLELEKRCSVAATFEHTFWGGWRKHLDLSRFRAEGHYLTQSLIHNPEAFYHAQTVYTELVDDWNMIFELAEDAAFGCHAYTIAGRAVSRDLLDSILEIAFLRKVQGWHRPDRIQVLDIGAGYGRFAHRFLSIFRNARVTNVDGVPESTFLCEFYTKFRGLDEDRCQTVAPDRLDDLRPGFDIATNIHSWSECSRQTVRYWLELIRKLGIRFLFVVPHDSDFTSTERRGKDTFLPEIQAAGFRLAHQAPKFAGSETLCRFDPCQYYLFHQEEPR